MGPNAPQHHSASRGTSGTAVGCPECTLEASFPAVCSPKHGEASGAAELALRRWNRTTKRSGQRPAQPGRRRRRRRRDDVHPRTERPKTRRTGPMRASARASAASTLLLADASASADGERAAEAEGEGLKARAASGQSPPRRATGSRPGDNRLSLVPPRERGVDVVLTSCTHVTSSPAVSHISGQRGATAWAAGATDVRGAGSVAPPRMRPRLAMRGDAPRARRAAARPLQHVTHGRSDAMLLQPAGLYGRWQTSPTAAAGGVWRHGSHGGGAVRKRARCGFLTRLYGRGQAALSAEQVISVCVGGAVERGRPRLLAAPRSDATPPPQRADMGDNGRAAHAARGGRRSARRRAGVPCRNSHLLI